MIKIRRKSNDKAQLLIILSFILLISVMVITTLAAEISNIDRIVTSETYSDIKTEFRSIKETFGEALNYNLAEVEVVVGTNQTKLKGGLYNIESVFEETKDEYYRLELGHGYQFDAKINLYWFASEKEIAPAWIDETCLVDITLLLDDGNSCITESVIYSIVLTQ